MSQAPKTDDAVDATSTEKHPFDYVHIEGDPLRPTPQRTAEPAWPHLRTTLYGPWMHIGEGWQDTAQTRLLDDHMWEGDPAMEAVVDLFETIGAPAVRSMLDTALAEGIDAVPDAPDALIALFDQLDTIPDWYDPEVAERGRVRLAATTPPAKIAAGAFGIFATASEEDASGATGATGRMVRMPVRRAVESHEFFESITYRGALHRWSPTFTTIVHVRLMHSLVRKGLRKRWGTENFAVHGMPISNTNMAAGSAWFATMPVLTDAVHGRPITMRELDDISVHWGYILYLFGVAERIIPTSGMDAIRLANHVFASAGEPSQWQAELAEALLAPSRDSVGTLAGRVSTNLLAGSIAALMGDDLTEEFLRGTSLSALNVPRARTMFTVLARVVSTVERFRDRLPGAQRRHVKAATVGDPFFIVLGKRIRALGAANDVPSSSFTHHDGSAAGSDFSDTRPQGTHRTERAPQA